MITDEKTKAIFYAVLGTEGINLLVNLPENRDGTQVLVTAVIELIREASKVLIATGHLKTEADHVKLMRSIARMVYENADRPVSPAGVIELLH